MGKLYLDCCMCELMTLGMKLLELNYQRNVVDGRRCLNDVMLSVILMILHFQIILIFCSSNYTLLLKLFHGALWSDKDLVLINITDILILWVVYRSDKIVIFILFFSHNFFFWKDDFVYYNLQTLQYVFQGFLFRVGNCIK